MRPETAAVLVARLEQLEDPLLLVDVQATLKVPAGVARLRLGAVENVEQALVGLEPGVLDRCEPDRFDLGFKRVLPWVHDRVTLTLTVDNSHRANFCRSPRAL